MSQRNYSIVTDYNLINTIDSNSCLCELIEYNSAKPFIDFDNDIEQYIEQIEEFLVSYFKIFYEEKVTICWKWSKDYLRLSKHWHCVISGVFFLNRWKENCLQMAKLLLKYVPGLDIDMSIYRYNSCLRLSGQSKPDMNKHNSYHKKLHCLHRYDIYFTLISIREGSSVIISHSSEEESLSLSCNFVEYTHIDLKEVDLSKLERILDEDMLRNLLNYKVPTCFKIDKKIRISSNNAMVRLLRLRPSYCSICDKTHDRENSYLIVTRDNIRMGCFRSI